MKKVLVLTNSINGLYSFRKEFFEKLIDDGYKVIIVAPKDEQTSYFTQIGCVCIDILINRRSTNPITDFRLLYNYLKIIKKIKPNVVLSYTIKPNVYGGIACRILRVPFVANITGLGTSIENKGLIQKVSLLLYKIGLKKANCVFFQNKSNLQFFFKNKLYLGHTRLIPGSGVNLLQHKYEEYPDNHGTIKFLFIGRLMKAKGIDELLEVAKKIKDNYSAKVEFHIVGPKEDNYTEIIERYERNRIVIYHGVQKDVHNYIKDSNAIINPSYHEGMSNVLLESASTGRPVLASNIPGCIETFENGVTGFAFEVKSVDSLYDVLIKFIELPDVEKKQMGIMGRKKIENEFDRNIVVNAYLDEIKKL